MSGHRRVIVAHRDDGTSFVASDERLPEVMLAPKGNALTVLWGGDDVAELPAFGVGSSTGTTTPFVPPPGGWRASLLTFQPDAAPLLPPGAGTVLEDLARQMQRGGGRGMHTTASVDVVLIVSGELVLEIDDGTEVVLRRGDTVVQNGTRHGWRNRGGEPATIALFMVGANHGAI